VWDINELFDGYLYYDVIIYCVNRFGNLKLHKHNKSIEDCLVLFERHNEKDWRKKRKIKTEKKCYIKKKVLFLNMTNFCK
jgi:hypothetical protein